MLSFCFNVCPPSRHKPKSTKRDDEGEQITRKRHRHTWRATTKGYTKRKRKKERESRSSFILCSLFPPKETQRSRGGYKISKDSSVSNGSPWGYRMATMSVGNGLKRAERFPIRAREGVCVCKKEKGAMDKWRFKNEGPRGESKYMMDRQRHVKPCSPLRFYRHTHRMGTLFAKHFHWSIRSLFL